MQYFQFIEDRFKKNLVRLIYFDEAGTASTQPINVVAAVIVHGDKQMPGINAEVRNLLKKMPVDVRPKFELKADRMFRHVRKFGDNSRYAEMMTGFLSIIRDFELPIEHCAMKRNPVERKAGYKINDLAFIRCLSFVGMWLKKNAPREGGFCIADKSRSDDKIHQMVNEYRRMGLIENVGLFDNFVDGVVFADSKRSIGLQIADYANFFIKMHLMGDSVAEPFFKIIEPLCGSPPVVFKDV